MANSVNKIMLLGRLGHDPEVRSTQSGKTVATLSLATSEYYGSGEDKKEQTTWHKVVLWDKLGQLAGNYLKKGSKVYVEGKITYRQYEDKNQNKRTSTEIVGTNLIFLDGKDANRTSETQYENNAIAEQAGQYQTNTLPGGDPDVPF